ncbi:hypothetical protein M8998_04770 [Sphingobacterium sp. lm-10]|uniref:hypothetical protein n=1 Tax=Sphingobacterium sp. lm-10 TaxID=2944904 RepID=UPI002022519D|nr:hypothetical protein [Sphingobacterium sp. lm-10]MCL7987251.1 hypothetical protein [Sphingobacterium sp. lm-10]
MEILTGKEEVHYLIRKVIVKFEEASGQVIVCNTNRENYAAIAQQLSLISNELPFTAQEKQHQEYPVPNDKELNLQYPHRQYDLTGGQIKDVYFGLVKKPRPQLVDACYIYLYGVGRLGFEKNPVDNNLLVTNTEKLADSTLTKKPSSRRFLILLLLILGLFTLSTIYLLVSHYDKAGNEMWTSYQPSDDEIASITGIWMYQTGAPQARSNEANRYRRYANNIMTIKKVGNRLLLERHGATINHSGYVEFTSPGILSIHSFVARSADGSLVNPSHSLAKLAPGDSVMYAISSTWSFESDDNNDLIGARNIYTKLSDIGELRTIVNTPENAACHCKIVEWTRSDGATEKFNLTYATIEPGSIEEDLDENSVILRKPKQGVLLSQPYPVR